MVSGGWLVLETVIGVAARVPWERFVRPDPKEVIPIPPPPQPKPEPALDRSTNDQESEPVHPNPPSDVVVSRPGCTTADEALVVKGHLDGLAKGWGGFGVLRTSKERLDKAVIAARIAGSPEVSGQLAKIANELSEVKTPEDAERVASELDEVLPKAWELGKRCKGLTPEMLARARELAGKVSRGEMTKDAAIKELSEVA